jgi:hypothetical protein
MFFATSKMLELLIPMIVNYIFGTSCGISSGFLIAFIPQGESAYSEEWV